ncbi:MAG: Lrp/AsnC ligand binding domain-containing protein [Paracoccaceae bacterium]|nr:Lrp/AsnC ligand binding domain-containing protein [Paracoccaceae bacterium]
MTCIFVQIRCKPGRTYDVANAIILKEVHSEMYSTSGDFDLLVKLYLTDDQEVGRFVNDTISSVEGVERTLTTLTFSAF